MFYVYVLQNINDKKFYIGFTSNIQKRINDHNSGKGGQSTRHRKWKLIYLEGYLNKKDALGREKFLKGGSGHKYLKKQMKNYLEIIY